MAGDSASTVDLSESRGVSLLTAIIFCTVISGLNVGLRLYNRIAIMKKVFPHDYLIIAGWAGCLASAVCLLIETINGLGRHIATVTPAEVITQNKTGVGATVFYHYCHVCIKSSIILQYSRICVLPTEKRICYGALVVVIAEGIGLIVTLLSAYSPFEALWNPHVVGGGCVANTARLYVCSVVIISADIFILIFPVFLLRHSLVPWYRKLAIGTVLAFGGVACIVSILRVEVTYLLTTSKDATWDKIPTIIYGVIELNLGVICSSVMTLRPLFSRYIPVGWTAWIDRRDGVKLGRVTISDVGQSNDNEDIDGEHDLASSRMKLGNGTDPETRIDLGKTMSGSTLHTRET